MIKRGWLLDKKAENLIFPIVIFIILNLMFFLILLAFVYKSATGALVYEQAYSKQIALMIDAAKPSTELIVDFKKGIEVAEKNKITSKENLVDMKNNKVIVKLSNEGGYSFAYFSDYDVSSYFNGNYLVININEKSSENEE